MGARASGPRPASGFTLIEMLVVILILALLIVLLVPALNNGMERASGVACLAQMREIGSASMQYAANHHGILEGGYSSTSGVASGRRAWYYYLADPDDPYLNVGGYEDRSLRCTKSTAGHYGMYDSNVGWGGALQNTPDKLWFFQLKPGVDWPGDPGFVGGTRKFIRIYAVPNPANTLYLACTSAGNTPQRMKTGYWFFTADGPWSHNTSKEGVCIWFAHSDRGANGVFLDGHARLCTPEVLLNVDNHPPGKPERGIRVWKLKDGAKVVDGVTVE